MTARETLDGIQARYEASQRALANDSRTVSIRSMHRLSESANDVPRLSNAVETVLARLDEWDSYKAFPDAEESQRWYSLGKRHAAEAVRDLIENALKEGQ